MFLSHGGAFSGDDVRGQRNGCPAKTHDRPKGAASMNPPSPDPAFPNQPSDFDSQNTVDLIVDLVGDHTVRPMHPDLLRRLLAEKELMARFGSPTVVDLVVDLV